MLNSHTIRHTVVFQLHCMIARNAHTIAFVFCNRTIPRYPWMLLPNNRPAPWGANYSLAEEFEGMIDANHPVSCFVSARFLSL
jgi:hypothetical protein